jgi:hypothetical protein
MVDNKVDIEENYLHKMDSELLSIILKDRSSKNNIIWATDNYESKGFGYQYDDNITIKAITGRNGRTIRPRTDKAKKELQKRTRDKAEVFTPSWICNAQNNLIDEAWFGHSNVFNVENNKTWTSTIDKIKFPHGKEWQDYVKDTRLEITCGEAPYLASRYDTVSGEIIKIKDRIGLLDRKLRIINENLNSEREWYDWVKIAYQNIYGYDWQGDNILLARENLLLSFEDYYIDRFGLAPIKEYMLEIAEITSWNIWQMDGLKCVIPNSCRKQILRQLSLFDNNMVENECYGCKKNDIYKHTGIYCKIKDWDKNRTIKYVTLLKGKK